MYYEKSDFLYSKKSGPCYHVVMGKKMGRPPKAKSERRDRLIPLRVTADELKAIGAAAKAAGTNRSEWIRKVLTAAWDVIQ